MHSVCKRRKLTPRPRQGTKRRWKALLAAPLLALSLSGCVTSHVWHEASHHGCDNDAAKVLLIATPVLLAIDLLLIAWQFDNHGCR